MTSLPIQPEGRVQSYPIHRQFNRLLLDRARPKLPGAAGLGGAALAFLCLLGIPARRRGWRNMLGVLVLIFAFSSMGACGGGSNGGGGGGSSGTTAGTYTFTVTATGSPAVTPAPTTTFTLTVN